MNKEELHEAYWLNLMSYEEIAEKFNTSSASISRKLKEFGIPQRRDNYCNLGCSRVLHLAKKNNGYAVWIIKNNKTNKYVHEHRWVAENEMGIKLGPKTIIHHKDGNSLNNHPLNLIAIDTSTHSKLHSKNVHCEQELPKNVWFYNHMVFAMISAETSHCKRLKVGCVITNHDLDQVYSFGYNGSAKGMANDCDSEEQGKCGCLHAEINSLIKVQQNDKNKVMFCSHSPCMACAKAIINSGFKYVYYGDAYRDIKPLRILNYYGIRTCPYPLINKSDKNSFVFEKTNPLGVIPNELKYEIRDNFLIESFDTELDKSKKISEIKISNKHNHDKFGNGKLI